MNNTISPMSRKPPNAIGHDVDGPVIAAFEVELRSEFASPQHSHPRGQMIGCNRGLVTILTDTGSWLVPAGHAIWLPPYQVHAGQSFGPGAGWSLYVSPDACRALPATPRTVLVPPLLREAVLRAASWPDDSMDEARQRIAALVISEIADLRSEALGLPIPRDPRMQRIARALLESPADRRGIEEWAAWAGTSSRTLSRRFRQETGLTFVDWRQRVRLMRSLEMLADGAAVTTVALDLGYSSVSGFIALFRRTFGVTPTAHPIGRPQSGRISRSEITEQSVAAAATLRPPHHQD
ncbi:AraC family transcriptional regulator [Bradyrhizobium liaoningense]|uniref:AraC family transcriptional regulator n=1 Tax=Bradyrhizobium liaoningense TaxID=43992 RepID=UPI001BA59F20|nr:helix-turn-helix transcriptional regulator [Bradyrhizobium liaoningense]MBR0855911.1 helix-turn-helix transcriptional regulator [Bradyrhizobium liaoningense]